MFVIADFNLISTVPGTILRASLSLVEKLAEVALQSPPRIKLYMPRKSTMQYGLVFKRLKIEMVEV